ncbi:tetratricopeptide repeat protein [cf. Phormidesmis sp. LEGE 11477]|uniref:tetratricopeptide repeat protein n=1 Tax=cf. Phormidesmis sp. LEGE 11477 TaxID=1828680 RepID=UPI00187E8150|nr:SEL1-like repeat protein [cf. Phormidesmis sp. LEGE 11477]MBE9062033.1 sel1 repeat family protein [cf. Phormidesmis sp. LEGE 11477]
MSVPGIKEFRTQQFTKALPLLIESAQAGHATAQCMLGNMYQLGIGNVEVNESAAIYWYYQAAQQGYSTATGNLAGMVWAISPEAATALHQLSQQQQSRVAVQAS